MCSIYAEFEQIGSLLMHLMKNGEERGIVLVRINRKFELSEFSLFTIGGE